MAAAYPTPKHSTLLGHSCTSTCGLNTSTSYDQATESTEDLLVQRRGEIIESEQEATSSDVTQIYLSLIWGGGKLGAAYYDVETTEIFLMLDTLEHEDFKLLKNILQQISPTYIVTSSKQDDRILKVLKDLTNDSDESQEERQNNFYLLPSIDFSLDICKRRILSLELPGMPEHFNDSEKTLFLSSLVPMEQTNMVRALGGLLKLLDKKRVGVELEDAQVRVPILALKTFTLLLVPRSLSEMDLSKSEAGYVILLDEQYDGREDLVMIDDNSYSALQIFQREAHPSVYKAASWTSSKEGLSLYVFTNVTEWHHLQQWFMRPCKNIKVLNERLDAVDFFVSSRNVEVNSSLQNCLRHIKNIAKIIMRMSDGQATPADWQAIYKTVYNAIYIADICRGLPKTVTIFNKIVQTFNEDLHIMANLITKIVDFEESVAQNRFVVKPNVDPDLDQRKRTFNGLPDFMTKVAKEEIKKLSKDIAECNVIYLPQLGYLLVIPVSRSLEQSHYEIPDLTFMFTSSGMAHYKSEKTKELDELLGDTQCEIADQEMGIMLKLQSSILEHSKVLLDVMTYAAELDCIIALATSARENNYVRPQLTTTNILEVKGSRHPLQELCCDPFVPNDIQSGGEYGKMKVLTGPNASGKSVYLKQVAIVVFMAHIGSFVPAETAVIGLTDKIFTRIRTMESVSVGLSTFMIDLNQVANAVNNASERSLVVLDEFGKGTETNDGVALLCSCLSFWLNKGDKCPHTYVSTHFHSIVQQDLLPRSPQLSFQTMEVLKDGLELVFLYQLVEGTTNSSYACHVATLAGLPEDIVKRGAEVTELLKTNQQIGRINSASSESQHKCCETIVEKFMALNFERDDLNGFLQMILQVSKEQQL